MNLELNSKNLMVRKVGCPRSLLTSLSLDVKKERNFQKLAGTPSKTYILRFAGRSRARKIPWILTWRAGTLIDSTSGFAGLSSTSAPWR